MISTISITLKVCAIIWLAGMLFVWLARPSDGQWVKTRALPLAIGLFAAGMITPSIWVMYAIMVAVIPLMARSRSEAAALYIVLVLSLPRLPREIGIGGAYLFVFDKWLMGAIGMAIAWVKLPARGPTPKGWFDLPFILVILLEFNLARGLNLTSFLRTETVVVLAYILPYYLVTRSLRTPDDVRRLLVAMCFCAMFLSFIGFYEARTFFLVYDSIGRHLGASEGLSSYTHQRSGMLRAAGSFGEATTFGLFLARSFIATLALRDVFRAKRYWLAALGVIGIGLYVTNARGPVIAMGIGLVCYDVYRKRYQSLAVKVGLFGLIVAMALAAAQFSTSIAERLGMSGNSADSADYRHQLLVRGLEQIAKHPILGVNVERTMVELADLRQGEGLVDFVNGYIYYGMTAGVPGIAAMLLCFVLTAWKAWTNRRRLMGDRRLVEMGGIVFAIAMMTMFAAATTGFGGRYEIIFYLFIGLGSALAAMRLAPPERPAPQPAEPAPRPHRPLRSMA